MITYETRNLALDRASSLIDTCRKKLVKIAIAESCTGGTIASLLTSVPGASKVLYSAMVTYSTKSKVQLLGINSQLIKDHGVVSGPVAEAMATQVAKINNSTIGFATTGYAGPDTENQPHKVGLIYFGLIKRGCKPYHVKHQFMDLSRQEIIIKASLWSLDILEASISNTDNNNPQGKDKTDLL